MKIGIDIDNTVTTTNECELAYVHQYITNELKKRIPLSNDSNYSIFQYLSKEQAMDFYSKYGFSVVKNVQPKTLAVKYLKKIKKNNDIIFITSRPEILKLTTIEWLKKHKIEFNKIYFTDNKFQIANFEKLDAFIDDDFQNCMEISKLGIKVLIMAANNDNPSTLSNMKRVYSWPQLYNELFY